MRYTIFTKHESLKAKSLKQAIHLASLDLVCQDEVRIEDNINRKIRLVARCPGEAHENSFIDHCAVCLPNWGIVVKEVEQGHLGDGALEKTIYN